MIQIEIDSHDPLYWNAHRYVCDLRVTDENRGIPYARGLRELFIKWWWEELGVMLHHEFDDKTTSYNISLEFPSERDWLLFILRWS